MEATKDMMIAKVIELDEGTAEILMNAGMHCLGCPHATAESMEMACLAHGANVDELIAQLNAYLADKK